MNAKIPLVLITIMLLLLPSTIARQRIFRIPKRSKTSSRSSACLSDVCISEVLVNAFGSETGAVGPSDWTSGEWVELLQLRNSYSRLILMDD